jgi:putative hydrolase of the HAD superfamily
MITCVVFDLDDTLFDEMEFVKSGYLEIANFLNATFGVDKTLTYNRLIDLFELDRKRVLNRLCSELNIEVSDILIKLYRYHQPTISLKSDVNGILSELKKSFKLGILTDGDPVTQRNKFIALGLQNHITTFVCTGELGEEFSKPHPRGYKEVAKKLDCSDQEMIYIGDNPNKDFYISTELNIVTVQLLSNGLYQNDAYRGGVHPHYKIHSLLELPKLIEEINRVS